MKKCKICGMKTTNTVKDYSGIKKSCCEPCRDKYGEKIDIAMEQGSYGKKKVILGL